MTTAATKVCKICGTRTRNIYAHMKKHETESEGEEEIAVNVTRDISSEKAPKVVTVVVHEKQRLWEIGKY